jgi:molecular chaperone GrpE
MTEENKTPETEVIQEPIESIEEPQTDDKTSELEAEAAKYKDLYLRAMAETENVRARAKRETEDANKYATTKFARNMVGVLENIMRAFESISEEAKSSSEVIKQVADGIDITIKDLNNIFDRNGIKRIYPVSEKFDHNFHQAVAQVESEEAQTGTVLQVLQAGYVLHDRLLRPAMVTVSAAKTSGAA